jgi:predicted acetylornithine/succinylornithine family transaminase/N-acetyl-ornithine/N-acetyl-lysine deacetylase
MESAHTSGVYGKRPLAIVRGSGALLYDAEGREYIDCAAGHGVANIGHARPEIAAAIAAQAQTLITCQEALYNDVRARLLSRLVELAPPGLDRFFLCNSGTEAVEGALKFARLATGRTEFVATLRGFHGRTMGALSTTWEKSYREPFAPLVPGVTHIRFNDLSAAEAVITERTAAVIIELVQGEGGVHVAAPEYVRALAVLCRERGALLIVDEVQTGLGRTGTMFACERYELSPDILCLAKSLGGGVPIGAVGLGPRVIESGRITRGAHGSTFGGNPMACASALATLDIIEREGLPSRAAVLGERALSRLRGIESDLMREVRGLGLMIGIELRERVQPYLEMLLERGVIALPAGPNVLRLLPPLVITESQLDRALDVIEQVLGGRTAALSITSVLEASDDLGSSETRLLHQALTIPSLSGQERMFAEFLCAQSREMGLDAHIDEAGNLIAIAQPVAMQDQGADPVVLLGHMDTVGGVVPVRVSDGLLYGRGAVDAKGPLLAFLCGASRLARSGELRRPVVVVGAVEEEAATSKGARAVIDRYHPAACIIGEPSGAQAVTIGYKGRLLVQYEIARESSHSAGPHSTASEVAAGFWQRVQEHAARWNGEHAGQSAFAALLPSLRSIQSHADGLVERANLLIGYRLPPGYEVAALRSELEGWGGDDGAHITFSGEEAAFQTSRTTPLARATGGNATFKVKTGTSDMNVVGPHWGENIVAYGPGDSSLDHTPNEHISLSEYLYSIDVLEQVLRTLAT